MKIIVSCLLRSETISYGHIRKTLWQQDKLCLGPECFKANYRQDKQRPNLYFNALVCFEEKTDVASVDPQKRQTADEDWEMELLYGF